MGTVNKSNMPNFKKERPLGVEWTGGWRGNSNRKSLFVSTFMKEGGWVVVGIKEWEYWETVTEEITKCCD